MNLSDRTEWYQHKEWILEWSESLHISPLSLCSRRTRSSACRVPLIRPFCSPSWKPGLIGMLLQFQSSHLWEFSCVRVARLPSIWNPISYSYHSGSCCLCCSLMTWMTCHPSIYTVILLSESIWMWLVLGCEMGGIVYLDIKTAWILS